MFKKQFYIILFLSLLIVGGLFYVRLQKNRAVQIDKTTEISSVRFTVENFGMKMKNVSLLSFSVEQQIDENYQGLVDPQLINQWKNDLSKAPGKSVSSPWPERIEIDSIKQFGSGAYDVSGRIIEMTSTGVSGEKPIQLSVVKYGNNWLIAGVNIIEASNVSVCPSPPGEYLLRSNCPYTSARIDGECRVICPIGNGTRNDITCQQDSDCDCSWYSSSLKNNKTECRCNEGKCAAVIDKNEVNNWP